MGVNRRFLYWGVFFLAMGGVMVAVQMNGFDATVVDGLLQLWPVALIALGGGLLLRRTRASLAGGMMAAAVPGLLLGSVIAAGPEIANACGSVDAATFASRSGTFTGPAQVDLTLRCGSLSVNTATGNDWSLDSGSSSGLAAKVESSATSLSIDTGARNGVWGLHPGRDAWRLTLPTANPVSMNVQVKAGEGRLNLTSAQLDQLQVNVNAGDARVDLTNASVNGLNADLSVGSLRIDLPNADYTGRLSVSVGDMRICAPSDLGLRISSSVSMGSADLPGLVSSGGAYETSNYATATHHAQLTVNVSLGSVKLNPLGGCL